MQITSSFISRVSGTSLRGRHKDMPFKIIRLKYAAILMCGLCCSGAAARAASNHVELRWSELAPVIVNHKVKAVLPDGAVIQGLVAAVRDDALVLNTNKTSGRKGYPGENVIPRALLTTLQIDEFRGAGGRTIGVIVGALGGLILGGDLVAHTAHSEAAAVSSFMGISTASAIAGYYAGRSRDHNVTTIKIVHEQ